MSLGVVIKGPEGVVLAADSRVTLEAQRTGGPVIPVNFDNATKFLSFDPPHNYVAAVTYGAAVIGSPPRTAHSFLPEFPPPPLKKGGKRASVKEYAEELSRFFKEQWKKSDMPSDYKGPDMTFIVGGYDEGAPYGRVFLFGIPRQPEPQPRNENDFGMTWGGQLDVASRLIHGYDPNLMTVIKQTLGLDDQKIEQLAQVFRQNLLYPIPYQVLPLQDCIDLATFLIRSTMTIQSFAVGVRGVGGPIDVAVIAPTRGLRFIQRKELHGEKLREQGEGNDYLTSGN